MQHFLQELDVTVDAFHPLRGELGLTELLGGLDVVVPPFKEIHRLEPNRDHLSRSRLGQLGGSSIAKI